jgi:hypothetical protein
LSCRSRPPSPCPFLPQCRLLLARTIEA